MVNSAVGPEWNTGEQLVVEAFLSLAAVEYPHGPDFLAAANRLDYDTASLSSNPTLGRLVLLAHIDLQHIGHFALLGTYLPVVLTCLKANNGLDETS